MPVRLSLLIVAIIITPLLGTAQNTQGELKGAVKYKTANGSLQADAGAEVIIYLIDSVRSTTDKYYKQRDEDSILNNSFLATIYYEEWEHTPVHKAQKEMARKLKALDAYPEEKLHDLDNLAASIIKDRERRQSAKTIVDKNGNYSVKLYPGYYGIIFRSRHLRSRSKTENNGNIMLDNVLIKPGAITGKNEEML